MAEKTKKVDGRSSPAARKRASDRFKGQHISEERREKHRQGRLGKTHTEETKERMRQAKLGKVQPETTKEAIREGWKRREAEFQRLKELEEKYKRVLEKLENE